MAEAAADGEATRARLDAAESGERDRVERLAGAEAAARLAEEKQRAALDEQIRAEEEAAVLRAELE